jgi:hypothetical protein
MHEVWISLPIYFAHDVSEFIFQWDCSCFISLGTVQRVHCKEAYIGLLQQINKTWLLRNVHVSTSYSVSATPRGQKSWTFAWFGNDVASGHMMASCPLCLCPSLIRTYVCAWMLPFLNGTDRSIVTVHCFQYGTINFFCEKSREYII